MGRNAGSIGPPYEVNPVLIKTRIFIPRLSVNFIFRLGNDGYTALVLKVPPGCTVSHFLNLDEADL